MRLRIGAVLLGAALQFGTTLIHAEETIQAFTSDSFSHIKAGHAGKPFIVMVWSLDCAYCQESLAALAEASHKTGISIVTIATDRAIDNFTAGLIRKKLNAAGLASNIWAFGNAPDEQLRYAIDPKWRGELPRTYWFRANGESTAHSGLVTAQVIAKLFPPP